SDAEIAIDLTSVPALDGVTALVDAGVRTSADRRNRSFAAKLLRTAPAADRNRLALAFDPQTAGGLLVSLPEARGDDLLVALHAAGVFGARIGRVVGEGASIQVG